MGETLHTTDFHSWTHQQTEFLRAGRMDDLDIENIAEEIEDMGKSLQRELVIRLKVLFTHLLKWQFQSGYRGNSWLYTIEEQRFMLIDLLQDNPSLSHRLPEAMQRSYKYALTSAARETGLPKNTFPEKCPWSFEQAIDEEFWPE